MTVYCAARQRSALQSTGSRSALLLGDETSKVLARSKVAVLVCR